MPNPDPAAIAFLAARRSYPAKMFAGPVPDTEQLTDILTTALRVPDHGKLEPWRLIVLGPADMRRLADLAEAQGKLNGADDEKIAKGRGQFDRGALAVAVISSPKDTDRIPLAEQILSAGALCFGVVNAATAAGWGANWLTGWVAHDVDFANLAFGCTPVETVAGLIHIGTCGPEATDRPRPNLDRVVQWGLA